MAPPHHLTPALVISMTASLVAVVAAFSGVGIRLGALAKGRRAILQELASRGETPTRIAELPVAALGGAGLASGVVFHVTARAADGAPRTYDWAYEPGLLTHRPRPLKHLNRGIWIPLA
jgi:hypothetical protein